MRMPGGVMALSQHFTWPVCAGGGDVSNEEGGECVVPDSVVKNMHTDSSVQLFFDVILGFLRWLKEIPSVCLSSALRDGQTALMKHSDLDLANGNVFLENKNSSGWSFGSVKLVRNA